MINESQFVPILDSLLAKSRSDKVIWRDISTRRDSAYRVDFEPNLAITVSYQFNSESPDQAFATMLIGDKAVATIEAEDGAVSQPNNFILIQQLFLDAERSLYHLDDALRAINESLASEQPTGTSSSPATERSVLSRIAGVWKLDFSKGKEELRIDDSGNYFIQHQGKEICYFTLENVNFAPSTNVITFRKVQSGIPSRSVKGQFHSKEELTLSHDGNTMAGVDDPFHNKLLYTRSA